MEYISSRFLGEIGGNRGYICTGLNQYSTTPKKITVLESLCGRSGWLSATSVTISSFETELDDRIKELKKLARLAPNLPEKLQNEK